MECHCYLPVGEANGGNSSSTLTAGRERNLYDDGKHLFPLIIMSL